MFPFTKKKSKQLTDAQREIEQQAIQMLTRAQKLLQESPHNVEEAQKLRFEVTTNLLPPKKMYILKKNGRSLLLDVDRKIQQSHIQNVLNQNQENVYPNREKKPSEMSPRQLRRMKKYDHAAAAAQHDHMKGIVWMMVLILLAAIFLIGLKQFIGENELYNAFNWLKRY